MVINEEKIKAMHITTYRSATIHEADQLHVQYGDIELQNVTSEKNC